VNPSHLQPRLMSVVTRSTAKQSTVMAGVSWGFR
jgi:hypothetical protein